MKTVNGRKTKSCANCGGMGTNPRNPNKPCFFCHGTGQVESQLPYPFWWPINLVVTQPGVLVSTVPQLLFPGAPADTNQQGTNPARYKLGSDAPFQWMFNLLSATSPDVIGDARQWLALLLTDASTQGYPFMPAPVLASLFAGDARYPWPILEALTFGEQTEIVLTGYPVVYQGVTQQIGLADGATATFSGTIYGPVVRGSLTVTAAGVSGTDNGKGEITGTGITAGSVSTYTGPGVPITVSVTFTVDPVATTPIIVTFNQGVQQVNAQFCLQGSYLKDTQPGNVSANT